MTDAPILIGDSTTYDNVHTVGLPIRDADPAKRAALIASYKTQGYVQVTDRPDYVAFIKWLD